MGLRFFFFFSSRRRHTRFDCDWSSDVCSSDLGQIEPASYQSANGRTTVPLRLEPWGTVFVVFRHPAKAPSDRKSTRLNSSHSQISYAVFCLKKKKKINYTIKTSTYKYHTSIMS